MKYLKAALAGFLTLSLAACSSGDGPELKPGQGALRVSADADARVDDALPVSRSSEASIAPQADQLAISLVKSDGSYAKSWDSVADLPPSLTLGVGQYKLAASWGSLEQEGFDTPYFYGETQVAIEEGEEKDASVTATLAHTMVSVSYTEAFRNYFADYSATAHSEGGDFIVYAPGETRPAYLRPGHVTLAVSLTKPNGVSATLQPAEFDALACHHYHITLDVNGGETGQGVLTITFDDSVVGENVTVDLSDDVLTAPAPVVTAKGFTPDTPLEMVEQTVPAGQLAMTASAAAGLKSVTLTTQSPSLNAAGFPSEIDLLKATPEQQALLASLGLKTLGLWHNPDKMAIIDFTEVFGHISGSGEQSFALVVKDKLGKVNEPVILRANVEGVSLDIVNTPAVKLDATEASFTVSTTAPNVKDMISVEVYNYGAWSPVAILSNAQAASSRHRAAAQAKQYTLRFAIPSGNTDVQARVLFNGTPRAVTTINKRGALVSLEDDKYVFATQATFKVEHNPNVALSSLHYFVQGAGGEMTAVTPSTYYVADNRVTISGLTPGTKYVVKAAEALEHTSALNQAVCTTEVAAQLPNSGMEEWVKTDSGSNWELYYPASSQAACVWGTNNPMTTSQGSNYAYCRISGTKPATGGDARTGTAACISTQGWGSGNSAVGKQSTARCKYIDPGLLHLGDSRSDRGGNGDRAGILDTDDLARGLAFASRPAALKFWYKYTAVNSGDAGICKAYVYDAQGKQIAGGQVALGAQGSYKEVTIPFTYAAGVSKAAKIYVCFMSTTNAGALALDWSWITPPPFANVSRGEYYGARLYVDDISLTY